MGNIKHWEVCLFVPKCLYPKTCELAISVCNMKQLQAQHKFLVAATIQWSVSYEQRFGETELAASTYLKQHSFNTLIRNIRFLLVK